MARKKREIVTFEDLGIAAAAFGAARRAKIRAQRRRCEGPGGGCCYFRDTLCPRCDSLISASANHYQAREAFNAKVRSYLAQCDREALESLKAGVSIGEKS